MEEIDEIEELSAQYTRKELAKIARELGIDTFDYKQFPTKATVAAAVIKAKKAEAIETAEPVTTEAIENAEPVTTEEPATAEKLVTWTTEKAPEVLGVVWQKRQEEEAHITKGVAAVEMGTTPTKGKNGVFAKIAGIEAQKKENEEAVAKMDDGIRTQKKENEEAVAKIGEGTAKVKSGIEAQKKENVAAVARLQLSIRSLQANIATFAKDFYFG